eukprot:TRINITY_DN11219_c0_g1_i2.p1 TRINITY_DN11219_c0_g1~~TRINITY_DN11219_c0_g1_i2.p1  ORF type:complete len:839 (-),score=156.73 TRINITY_DN11219_c0_g1_i2:30-2546(-)
MTKRLRDDDMQRRLVRQQACAIVINPFNSLRAEFTGPEPLVLEQCRHDHFAKFTSYPYLHKMATVDRQRFINRMHMAAPDLWARLDWNNILLAGGSVSTMMRPAVPCSSLDINDLDIFFYDISPQGAYKKIVNILQLVSQVQEHVNLVRTEHTLTCYFTKHIPPLQFILRVFPTKESIICSFDVDACGIGFDGHNVLCTKRCLQALQTNVNVVDLTFRSFSFERRQLKYAVRGFAFAQAGLHREHVMEDLQDARNFVADSMSPHYQEEQHTMDQRFLHQRGLRRLLMAEHRYKAGLWIANKPSEDVTALATDVVMASDLAVKAHLENEDHETLTPPETRRIRVADYGEYGFHYQTVTALGDLREFLEQHSADDVLHFLEFKEGVFEHNSNTSLQDWLHEVYPNAALDGFQVQLLDLPEDCLGEILSHIDPMKWGPCALSCSTLHRICADVRIWRLAALRRFGDLLRPLVDRIAPTQWKQLYLDMDKASEFHVAYMSDMDDSVVRPRNARCSAECIGGKVYVWGGVTTSISQYAVNTVRRDIDTSPADIGIYDVLANTWTVLSKPVQHGAVVTMWPQSRLQHAAFSIGARMYVMHGRQEAALLVQPFDSDISSYFDDLWTFDTRTGLWERAELLGGEVLGRRSGMSATVLNRTTVLVFGGYEAGTQDVKSDAYLLKKVDTRELWQVEYLDTQGAFIRGRRNHTATLIDQRLFVTGGMGTRGSVLDDMIVLHLPSRRWGVPMMKGERLGVRSHAAIAVGHKLMLIGGYASKAYPVVVIDTRNMKVVPMPECEVMKCISLPDGIAAVAYSGRVLLFGREQGNLASKNAKWLEVVPTQFLSC